MEFRLNTGDTRCAGAGDVWWYPVFWGLRDEVGWWSPNVWWSKIKQMRPSEVQSEVQAKRDVTNIKEVPENKSRTSTKWSTRIWTSYIIKVKYQDINHVQHQKDGKAPTTLVQNPLWRKKLTTKTVFLGPKIEILQGGNPRLPAVSGSSIALQTHNYRA